MLPYDCAVEMEEGYVYELVDTMPVYLIYGTGQRAARPADQITTDLRAQPAWPAKDPCAAEFNA